MDVEFIFVDKIEPESSGKIRANISKILQE